MKGVQAAVLGGSALVLLILALRLTLKNHLPACPARYHRQVNMFFATLSFAQQQVGAYFTITGQIQGDMAGTTEPGMLCQLQIQIPRGLLLLCSRQGAALASEQTTQALTFSRKG